MKPKMATRPSIRATPDLQSLDGTIAIHYKMDRHSFVILAARGKVTIGKKINQHPGQRSGQSETSAPDKR